MCKAIAGVKSAPGFIFPLILGTFTAVTYVEFVAVYTAEPTPFIDEIFHIPQAQKYCQGNFLEWDQKITTLPGLYLFSIGLIGPVSWITNQEFCDVFCLRLTNFIGAVFLFSTIHKLLNYLHGDRVDGWKLVLASVNLGMFPVLHWFSFLYYTDVLSTLLVLIMMLLHIHRSPNFAAAMGVVAVFMRQTNIVWICFLAGLLAIDAFGHHVLRAPIQSIGDIKKLLMRLRKMVTKPVQLSECLANVAVDCLVYAIVIFSFVIFVMVNGSLVVGDKDSHVATVHLTQVLYFFLFFLIFSAPYAIECVQPFINFCKRYSHIMILLFCLSVFIVHSNTLVHPFMLADNRHYTFYIWNKFFGRWMLFRYVMVPIYLFGGYVLYNFIRGNSATFVILYLAATCASIVPQKLVEPRYFILPFLLARLQSVSTSWRTLCLETAYYLVINAATMFIFLNKTFQWEGLDQPQRIIW